MAKKCKFCNGKFEKPDPTANVTDLVNREVKRIDALLEVRDKYEVQLQAAEAKRLDSIRAVDAASVSTANDRAVAQASVLANQVSSSAEALRALVASTASTVAQQLSAMNNALTERIAALERGSYSTSGKGQGMEKLYQWVIAAAGVGIAIYVALHK
jgi:hypothetical protein